MLVTLIPGFLGVILFGNCHGFLIRIKSLFLSLPVKGSIELFFFPRHQMSS